MPKTRVHAALAACLLAATALPAQAIIMRHDVDEARYRALAEPYRPVLVLLGINAQNDGAPLLYSGMGTLIAPDWVITAAHAAARIDPHHKLATAKGEHYVFVSGRGYKVARVIIHPQWTGDDDTLHDIALVQLARAVNDPHPACLYDKADEQGQVVTLVGTGYAGNGRDGPVENADGVLRAATVKVDEAAQTRLKWLFRPPGDPATTPLEGISGPGDSGGPALIVTAKGACIAGVSSSQEREIDPTKPDSDNGSGRYGVREVYSRVSAFLPWIRQAMASAPPP